MIEEKGIYSVEKFLVARRQMYWQVYLHKTVLSAEKMLVKIIQRVRAIYPRYKQELATGSEIDYFLGEFTLPMTSASIQRFCLMDDFDVISAIKKWSRHSDKVLSILCTRLLNREIYKTSIQSTPFAESFLAEKQAEIMKKFGVNEEEAAYLCFTGIASNTTYQSKEEKINILYKDGSVKDITEVDNSMIQQNLSSQIKKFYICLLN